MVHFKTKVKVMDNSGVLSVKCIKLLRGSKFNAAGISAFIVVVVKQSTNKKKKTIFKGDVCRGLIVSSSSFVNRNYFYYIKTDINNIVVIGDNRLPVANRVFGAVFSELRLLKNLKILSLFHSFI